jgi:hypothetical protein
LSIGEWKTLAGASTSAAAQLFLGILYYGIEPVWQWVRTMWNVHAVLPMLEPKLYQTHSLRTFWSMLVPWPGLSLMLYIVSAVVVLGLMIACWKRSESAPLPLRYAALLLASALVAPHLTVYDLVILAPALILLADWLVAQPPTPSTQALGTLLYLIYMLPLIGPFARWTHIQPSVVAMALSVYLIWRISTSVASANARDDKRDLGSLAKQKR